MAFQVKFIFAIAVLIVLCCNSFDLVHGLPSGDLEPVNDETGNSNLTRVDRAAKGCNDRGGCYNGKCWAGCDAVLFGDKEWCYTTKGNSQDYQYIGCSRDHECSKCWKCAGACSV